EMEFPERTFDTIVSTLSFCAYEHPISLFNQLGRWVKPDGKILLLEHGISSNLLLKQIQKGLDPVNHRIVGCHLNRDMQELMDVSRLNDSLLFDDLRGL